MENCPQYSGAENKVFPIYFLYDTNGLLCMFWFGLGSSRMVNCGQCFRVLPVSADKTSVAEVANIVFKHLGKLNGEHLNCSWSKSQFIQEIIKMDQTIASEELPKQTVIGMVFIRSQLGFLMSNRYAVDLLA